MVDLGEGPWGPPPLILAKKKKEIIKNAEVRKAGRASDIRKTILLQHLKKKLGRLKVWVRHCIGIYFL